MKYVAVIGDIVDSRAVAKREEVQARFQQTCKSISSQRKSYGIVTPLMVTLGDEFQCVLGGAGGLWAMIGQLETDMHPLRFRFSIGVGEITTDINPKSSLGMDGPAFHNARKGINDLRKDGGNYRVTGLGAEDALVRHSLDLWSGARDKWNLNRLTTFTRLLEGASISDIANELDVSDQAVYRTRRDGQLDTVTGLLTEISAIVDKEAHG